MAPDFAARASLPELMDDPSVDYATFRGCLKDLAFVNTMTLGYRPTLRFFGRLRRDGRLPADRPLRVLDVGSGYGDMLRAVAAWAARVHAPVELLGADLNRWAARAAREATPPETPIEWLTADAFHLRPPGGVDIVISSLFTHHLDDAALVRFIRWMEETARVGWFVNDLHRRRLPYVGFRLASRALRLHPFVQHDGPVSIARSFVREDWERALAQAGAPAGAAEIERWFPYRLCVARVRDR